MRMVSTVEVLDMSTDSYMEMQMNEVMSIMKWVWLIELISFVAVTIAYTEELD